MSMALALDDRAAMSRIRMVISASFARASSCSLSPEAHSNTFVYGIVWSVLDPSASSSRPQTYDQRRGSASARRRNTSPSLSSNH